LELSANPFSFFDWGAVCYLDWDLASIAFASVRHLRLARMALFDAHAATIESLAALKRHRWQYYHRGRPLDFLDSWAAPSYRCEVTARVTSYGK
jgi:hypothetical protein